MTFAPPTLNALRDYIVLNGATFLGIAGDTAHQTKGVSYHLGADQLTADAYSRKLARDRAGLTNAASAIDIGKVGGSLAGLQKLSVWLAKECANRAIDTLDIREVIFSPDGSKVMRWDEPTQQVYQGGTGTGQGDDSHRTHTHVSFYRDAEFRDHTALFRRYFEEDEVTITKTVRERWHPTVTGTTSNGVLRAAPDRGAPIVDRIPATSQIVTVAEVRTVAGTDGNWRLVETADLSTLYALRADWISDGLAAVPEPIDCGPLVNAARQEGVAAGLRDGSRAVKDAAVNAAVLLGG